MQRINSAVLPRQQDPRPRPRHQPPRPRHQGPRPRPRQSKRCLETVLKQDSVSRFNITAMSMCSLINNKFFGSLPLILQGKGNKQRGGECTGRDGAGRKGNCTRRHNPGYVCGDLYNLSMRSEQLEQLKCLVFIFIMNSQYF
jgi:hypothetical protein